MTFYLGATPEAAVKPITIFFYGQNSVPAQELAMAERKALRIGLTRDAATFDGDAEACDAVVVMPDVPGWVRGRIVAAYGEKVVDPKAPEPEPVRRSYQNAHPEKIDEPVEPPRRQRVKEPVK